MHRDARAALLALLLLPVLCPVLLAQKWWEKKPYMQWSVREMLVILTDSPWARQRTANPYPDLALYQFNLLTARPVREAVLRSISLTPEKSIQVRDLDKSNLDREQMRLKEFIASNPDNLLINGDEKYIVVSLCLRLLGRKTPNQLRIFMDDDRSTERLAMDPAKLMSVTRLETDTGKQARLFHYEPPGKDNLGAKFFFKRKLADGSPLVSAADRELRFVTQLDSRNLRVKFDLRKMMYKGKLEF